MFSVSFSEPVTIGSQVDLRAVFQTDTLHMAKGASLTLAGAITLYPGIVFQGASHLAGPVRIETGCVLTGITLGGNPSVRSYSDIDALTAGTDNVFGPFCFIRAGCSVGDDCILGAHVETTRSSFGNGVKVSHRAFIGDAKVGDGVIIGAGVVFCNYNDGKGRLPTTVGDKAMIGSGTLLLAPIAIGAGAVIAAGSVVTKDVAAGARVIQKRV